MLAELEQFSEPVHGVTRLPFTPERVAAFDLPGLWMDGGGLTDALDDAGTLIGRSGGRADSCARM